MIDLHFLRENHKVVKKGAAKKNVDVDVDAILEIDEKRRALMTESQDLKAEQNRASDEIAGITDKGEREKKIEEVRVVKEKVKKLESKLAGVQEELDAKLKRIPNLPKEDVRVGKDDSENYTIREEGTKPKFAFDPKDYITLGEELDIIDTERAAKASGSRFAYLKGDGALLEFALINYAMATLAPEGFIPIITPEMIREEAMEAMGYLDRAEEEVFKTVRDGYRLIGTSEQAIGAMHMDETFKEEQLPKRYAAFSSCFRREAGSYGKDSRGIIRVHQFDKVEMFSFTTEENSDKEHEFLLSLQEHFMRGLDLPYQIKGIVSGDLGDPAARKYDIETWLPSQDRYLETHSASTCTDWQARRLNTRVKRKDGAMQFVHTINATALSMQRMIVVILENYQQEDGTIAVPQVLVPYMGGKTVIDKTV